MNINSLNQNLAFIINFCYSRIPSACLLNKGESKSEKDVSNYKVPFIEEPIPNQDHLLKQANHLNNLNEYSNRNSVSKLEKKLTANEQSFIKNYKRITETRRKQNSKFINDLSTVLKTIHINKE